MNTASGPAPPDLGRPRMKAGGSTRRVREMFYNTPLAGSPKIWYTYWAEAQTPPRVLERAAVRNGSRSVRPSGPEAASCGPADFRSRRRRRGLGPAVWADFRGLGGIWVGIEGEDERIWTDQVVRMRWPHGETPGRQPADQQQPLSPSAYRLVFPNRRQACSSAFVFRVLRPPPRLRRAPPPPPPNHRLQTPRACWGPLRPIRLSTARSAAPPLEPLGSGRGGLCMTAASGSAAVYVPPQGTRGV